jgi:hypothetical protein
MWSVPGRPKALPCYSAFLSGKYSGKLIVENQAAITAILRGGVPLVNERDLLNGVGLVLRACFASDQTKARLLCSARTVPIEHLTSAGWCARAGEHRCE